MCLNNIIQAYSKNNECGMIWLHVTSVFTATLYVWIVKNIYIIWYINTTWRYKCVTNLIFNWIEWRICHKMCFKNVKKFSKQYHYQYFTNFGKYKCVKHDEFFYKVRKNIYFLHFNSLKSCINGEKSWM